MKALIESAAKVGSRVRIGKHDLVFDQPTSVPGGEDRGPSPLDVLVAAIAACAHYYASAYLHGRGLPTSGLVLEVEAETERDPTPRVGKLAMKVRVPAGLPEDRLIGMVARSSTAPPTARWSTRRPSSSTWKLRRRAWPTTRRWPDGEVAMTDPIWTVSSDRMDAATARRTILVQHQEIRALLARAREVADRALDDVTRPADSVASTIGDIHATLENHLRFEETVLVDIFNDGVGPIRAERLRDEHARQRATLAGIHEEAKDGPLVPLLAAKLAFLASWLLDEMDEEERTMLTPDVVVRNAIVSRDQSDG